MDIHLETERLVLRRFTADDLDALLALHTDPAVMRYLGSRRPTRAEVRDHDLARYLDWYERSDDRGYWATVERSSGAFLGWHLFRPPQDREPAPGEIEIGWRMHTSSWGHGYATEAARALIDDGFAHRDLRSVLATTMAVNERSWKVMQRLGMRQVRTFHGDHDDVLPGADHGDVESAITLEEWKARR